MKEHILCSFFWQSLLAVDLFTSARDLMYFARINEVPSAPEGLGYSSYEHSRKLTFQGKVFSVYVLLVDFLRTSIITVLEVYFYIFS